MQNLYHHQYCSKCGAELMHVIVGAENHVHRGGWHDETRGYSKVDPLSGKRNLIVEARCPHDPGFKSWFKHDRYAVGQTFHDEDITDDMLPFYAHDELHPSLDINKVNRRINVIKK